MDIEVTSEAVEVLRRAFELAGMDPSTAGVRLRPATGLGGGVTVQIEFAAAPQGDEEIVEAEGIRLFVTPDLAGTVPNPVVTVEPQHDRVVVRPKS